MLQSFSKYKNRAKRLAFIRRIWRSLPEKTVVQPRKSLMPSQIIALCAWRKGFSDKMILYENRRGIEVGFRVGSEIFTQIFFR
jgi:hypothetical protein